MGTLNVIRRTSVQMAAICQVRKKLNTFSKLIISLSMADILVGCCVLMSPLNMDPLGPRSELCLFINWRHINMTSHLISLLNLLGLGLDHYYAVIRPLQYVCQMSSYRTNSMILGFWTISIACGFSDFFIPTSAFMYCEHNSAEEFCRNQTDFDELMAILNFTMEEFEPPRTDYIDSDVIHMTFHPDGGHPTPGLCDNVTCSKYDSEYLIFVLLVAMTYPSCRTVHGVVPPRSFVSGSGHVVGNVVYAHV